MKTMTVSKWTTALALTVGGALLATSAIAQTAAGTSPATSTGTDTKKDMSQPASSNTPSAPGATTGSTGSEMKSGAMKSAPARDAAQGATGEQVKAVQQALKDKGHDPGEVDGAMGPKTEAALRDFQQKEGLKATGRADSDTMAKLAVEAKKGAADKSSSAPAASPSGGSPSDKGAAKDAASTGAKQSK